MSRKVFWRITAVFVAAIAATAVLAMTIPALRSKPYSAILIPMTTQPGFEFWEFVERGAKEGAREFGVSLEIAGPDREDDVSGQIEIVYESIAKHPDMIILAPSHAERLAAPAQAVRDAGIKLILIDCTVDAQDPARAADCIVGINNREAAKLLADEMAKQLPDGGEVAILVDMPGATTAAERVSGIEEGLAAYPNISIAAVVNSGSTPAESHETAQRLLAEHPEIDGLFGTNPVSSEGAARFLRTRGGEHIFLYTFDTSTAMNEYLEEGTVDGAVTQIAFNVGYLGVEAGYLACRDQLRTGRMDSRYVYATQDNIRDENIQQLIYPFD